MSKKIFIQQLSGKEEVEVILAVKSIQLMEAKDGKNYLNILFTDSSGDLEGRMWGQVEGYFTQIAKNDVVIVKGRLNIYQGKKQFVVASMTKLNSTDYDPDDFVMRAQRSGEEMYQDLLLLVDKNTEDVYIRELLKSIITDPEISRRLKTWQAGKTIHHAYKGGLLEHILSCSQLGVSLSAHYNANPSYVMAGCILHDLCKIYELTDGINVEYTEEGKLVGHLVKGLELVDRFSYKIKNFPYQTKMHIKHILLSHHGEYEYGSPKIPQTSEAFLVHLIDLMDSKMNAFEMIKRLDNSAGHWSGFVKHLDRIVYKGSLPTYTDFIEEDESRPTHGNTAANSKITPKLDKKNPEIKQNLGKLLEGFKAD